MARTIAEIKKTMTDAFMADALIRQKYGLSDDDTFNNSFSSASLESLLFYIVAACHYVLETIWDTFNTKVDEKIATGVVASLPWYYKIARAFQYGDSLVWDEDTQEYKYETEDDSADVRIITYAAVRDLGTSVKILVSTGSTPTKLNDSQLSAFKAYMDRMKIAGVVLAIYSKDSDTIAINATIAVDGITIDSSGKSIGGDSYPVEDAINNYLKNIVYGGTFNKTKLVDAIQNVEGVVDVELGNCYANGSTTPISGNSFISIGGSFVSSGLSTSLTYVVSSGL